MYNIYLLSILTIFYLLIFSNSVLSETLRTNGSLKLLLGLITVLFSYNDIHIGFLMLAIVVITLLSVKRQNLNFDTIMNSFGFNPELFKFDIPSLPTMPSLSSLSSPFNDITTLTEDETTSEAESEFDDNVSDIDPNDYITDMDPTVNSDIDDLVNNYLQEEQPTSSVVTESHKQANEEEHITSEQLAEMFQHLQ